MRSVAPDGAIWHLLFLQARRGQAHHGAGEFAFLPRTNPDVPKLPYNPLGAPELDLQQRLGAWASQRRFRTGKVTFNDYDYLKPPKNLLASNEASEKYARSKLEVYDYPGKHDEENKGKNFSKFRLEAEQCFDHRRLSRATHHQCSRAAWSLSKGIQLQLKTENTSWSVAITPMAPNNIARELQMPP